MENKAHMIGIKRVRAFFILIAFSIFGFIFLDWEYALIIELILFFRYLFLFYKERYYRKLRSQSLDNLKQTVVKYKILEKYNDAPKWATYLYFDNGTEVWNQTIPGSWLAKNPESDLTFVHDTKEEALEYAKRTFISSQYIEE
jgi:hypothetical protein